MSFMQPDVFFSGYLEVETSHGTEIIPEQVCPSPAAYVDLLKGYFEEPVQVEYKQGWLARMSAPGYLDATEWTAHKTEKEAYDYLQDMYGED